MLAFLAGDYDSNGAVQQNDYDVWQASYGQATLGGADGNGDNIVNAADYVIWRNNLGKTTADLPPNAPSEISAAAAGPTSIEVNWETVATATTYAVQRRQPDTEIEFTTIAPSVAPTTYTDNSASADTLYEYRVVAQKHPLTSSPPHNRFFRFDPSLRISGCTRTR